MNCPRSFLLIETLLSRCFFQAERQVENLSSAVSKLVHRHKEIVRKAVVSATSLVSQQFKNRETALVKKHDDELALRGDQLQSHIDQLTTSFSESFPPSNFSADSLGLATSVAGPGDPSESRPQRIDDSRKQFEALFHHTSESLSSAQSALAEKEAQLVESRKKWRKAAEEAAHWQSEQTNVVVSSEERISELESTVRKQANTVRAARLVDNVLRPASESAKRWAMLEEQVGGARNELLRTLLTVGHQPGTANI